MGSSSHQHGFKLTPTWFRNQYPRNHHGSSVGHLGTSRHFIMAQPSPTTPPEAFESHRPQEAKAGQKRPIDNPEDVSGKQPSPEDVSGKQTPPPPPPPPIPKTNSRCPQPCGVCSSACCRGKMGHRHHTCSRHNREFRDRRAEEKTRTQEIHKEEPESSWWAGWQWETDPWWSDWRGWGSWDWRGSGWSGSYSHW